MKTSFSPCLSGNFPSLPTQPYDKFFVQFITANFNSFLVKTKVDRLE